MQINAKSKKPMTDPRLCLCMDSPLGQLSLWEENEALAALCFGAFPNGGETSLLQEARRQLQAYFQGRLKDFSLPLRPTGTPFQQSVWRLLKAIPYGDWRTYGRIASDLGSSPRAVGGACARNPIPIIIPCHRVTGAKGQMTGYSGGSGIAVKRFLLDLEARR